MKSLHLVITFLAFSCKAEVRFTNFTTDKDRVTEINSTYEAPDYSVSFLEDNSTNFMYTTAPELKGKDVKGTKTRFPYDVTQQTTTKPKNRCKSNDAVKPQSPATSSNPTCTGEEKYKTGLIICVIIIAVLVFIIAMLIVCIVALANKVSSLKTRLTQSKRQARSNGDFLSASSILWPSGMETWQKKANLTMDEISLGDANITENEKHKLMASEDLSKVATGEIATSPSAISTIEV
ncbi:hypothetical protein GDO81_005631 [Engystomops pustulosus]|uniref:Protein EVI2A n=1 Tax=Engystomops pustulosus TaxID=76066 RepID=A0AAV7CTB5_ENGPU|nr:hypothetical protein GDO81_005631 [Engystomops pustulosus]